MTIYSVQPSICVKGYGFLSFAKNIGKNIGKNTSKNLSVKKARNFLIMLKIFSTDSLKTFSKRVSQKTAEATGDLIGNKIANRIAKVPKNSQQNIPETVTNEHDNEMLTER